MSDEILVWPASVLRPAAIEPNVVAFSRSGGRTLGGLERVTRTDRGWWSIAYRGVTLGNPRQRRLWNAVAEHCGGMAGLLAVPVWSYDSVPWPDGTVQGRLLAPHSDGTSFSDHSLYGQSPIGVQMVADAAIGATSVSLRIGHGVDDLAGVRFSYQHALYRTGFPTAVSGNVWTVPISPAVRAPIPADADLEFGLPTCLVRLAGDREMDVSFSVDKISKHDVAFVEASDYWNDLAAD